MKTKNIKDERLLLFHEAKNKATTTRRLVEIVQSLKSDYVMSTKGSKEYNALYSIFACSCFHQNSSDEIVMICNIPEIIATKNRIRQREATAQ